MTPRGHESASAPTTEETALVGGSGFDPSWECPGFAEVVQGSPSSTNPAGSPRTTLRRSGPPAPRTWPPWPHPGDREPRGPGRGPQLPLGGPRLGDGSWLLLQYLAERDGEQLLGRMWREAQVGEDPLTTYKRLTGLSQADLNRRVAEYALRTVTWDFMDRSAIAAGVDRLDAVLLADRTTPVEAVKGDPGHYRVLDAFAPSDYGFTIVRLQPDPGVRDIHVRVRGHDAAADAGLSFGFVAMHGAVPRYSPVTESIDEQVQLTLRTGEDEAFLVVVGTPTVHHRHGAGDGFGEVDRYPYEFRVAGATVADEASTPTELGGHLHANGGGFVDDAATVDATAYVGPDAVVRGDARVLGGARIEGRAWIEAGAVVEGGAIVRDVAIVRSGARLSGTTLVAGDAVVDFTCAAGTTRRSTRHGPATAVRPGGTSTRSSPRSPQRTCCSRTCPCPPPPRRPNRRPPRSPRSQHRPRRRARRRARADHHPRRGPHPGRRRATGADSGERVLRRVHGGQPLVVGRAELVPGGGGRHAGGSGVDGWAVSWALPPGVQISAVWNARLGTSGSTATAENMSYNGSLRDGVTATFGFHGTGPGDAGVQVPAGQLQPTR